jgi:hypothetical protein
MNRKAMAVWGSNPEEENSDEKDATGTKDQQCSHDERNAILGFK